MFTAMRMAMLHEPDISPFGAVPERVRIDRGLEFAADAVEAALGLAVVTHRLPAFQPHRKGKVERLNLTIEQLLISQLPGFTGGPRDAGGKLYGPVKDSVAAKQAAEGQADGPMRIERFIQRFAAWARWYNTERPHRMLGGRTPLQAWMDDPAPLRRIPADELRHLMLASTERTIQKDGINFRSFSYVAPELYGRGGQHVQVRYMPHDDRSIEVRRLAAVEGPGRLIVRPTPAGRTSDLALDILTATGRSPATLLADRTPAPDAWRQAAAWLAADQIRHVVIDRAHRLADGALELLAEFGRRADATVWFIWPVTENARYVGPPMREFRDAGYRFDAIDLPTFMRELPPSPRVLTGGLRPDTKTPWAEGTGPDLPMQDFPVFLTHCRAKLPGNTFTAVCDVYEREVHLADQWLTQRGLAGHHSAPGSERHTRALGARLTFYLRDHRIGPAPDQAHALVRLRAVQVALFLRGYLLRWQMDTLGTGPTTRLLSQLTPRTCAKLRTAGSPEAAAATALSIHLSHGPTGFGLISCGNTAPDGSSVHLPHTGSQYEAEETRYLRVPWKWSSHRHTPVELTALQVLHLQSDDPVPLPEHAAPLVAAHLAYRRSQGATDTDPLFIHDKDPGKKSPELHLRETVMRTCNRIHFNPAWLHRSHCRHGDETAHGAASAGWMHYRGLDLTALSDDIRSRL